jgi:hypothetical protein
MSIAHRYISFGSAKPFNFQFKVKVFVYTAIFLVGLLVDHITCWWGMGKNDTWINAN